jgi:hypothetical protein
MSLYLYSPTLSEDAQTLTTALRAKRLLKHDGMHFLKKGTPIDFKPGDGVICWGRHVPTIPGVPSLNSSPRYRNPVVLNIMGATDLANSGYNAMIPTELRESDYRNYLSLTWPKTRPACNFVPLPDLPPLGTPFNRYSQLEKVFVFRGNAVAEKASSEQLQQTAVTYLERLGLDFAEFTFGLSVMYYVIKILATPKPSELLISSIQQWATDNGVQV